MSACGIVGGIVGGIFDEPYGFDRGTLGVFAGMFAFACVRLWFGPHGQKSSQEPN